MKNAIVIAIFTCCITGFYWYVGQLVPQKEVQPPQSAEISDNMSAEEMVAAGQIIVDGKGTCVTCHNGSRRFPIFDNVGAVAKTRRSGMSDVEYLAEALYEPGAFIVEPYAPGMPAVHKAPIGLDDQEILTVIAWLQAQGGEVTVAMDTKLKYQGQAAAAPAKTEASGGGGDEELDGMGLLAKYSCLACHSMDAPIRLVGPSLVDVGKRLTPGEIYQSLVDPDAVIAPGFPPGVMGATLKGGGFFDKVTPAQLKKMVDVLAEKKG